MIAKRNRLTLFAGNIYEAVFHGLSARLRTTKYRKCTEVIVNAKRYYIVLEYYGSPYE